jgi:DNA-binding CsgD family transcriptional regulator
MVKRTQTFPSDEAECRATRTVACIDVRFATAEGESKAATSGTGLLGSALGHIRKAVRADDRICPMGGDRVAVEFSQVASEVLPQVLGERLALAVGQQVPFDSSVSNVAVSVGIAAPELQMRPSDLTRRALSATKAGRSQLGRRPFAGTMASHTVVTVDRLLNPRALSSRPGSAFQSMYRRSVYRYDAGRIRSIPTLHPAPSSADSQRDPGDANDALTVLVVDPMASQSGDPGIAATTAALVSEQCGCRTAAVAVSVDDHLALAIDGVPLDAVIVVLDGGWVSHTSSWSSGAWHRPASLTASYRACGVPVLAVSSGSGAGAIAACVANGAIGLLNFDRLPDALQTMLSHRDGDSPLAPETSLPPQFRALVDLTTSERRVLFYLTEGWGAQEIADYSTVSMTTVRSHIRSILRKLGVRSQLAAVAIANGHDLEHDESVEAS